MPNSLAAKAALEVMVVVAAFLDLKSRRIPNWLTVSGMVAGLGINAFLGGWAGLKHGLLGMLLALAVYGALFAIRAMGGGDVKLMMAVGSFTGPEAWLWIFAIASIAGGLLAIVTLVTRGGFVRTLSNMAAIVGSLIRMRAPHHDRPDLDVSNPSARTLPHGAAIAIGALIYLLIV